MPRYLPLQMLESGMVCAAPVSTADGRTLCAAGTALSVRILQRLRGLGVAGVEVLDEEADDPEQTVAQIRHRFRRVIEDAAMADVCALYIDRVMRAAQPQPARSPEPAAPVEIPSPSRLRARAILAWLGSRIGRRGDRRR